MIGYLKGEVLATDEKNVILNVSGVGYELLVPGKILSEMKVGAKTEFYVHTHVREDQLGLFGFASLGEREFFRKLISVSGIGPKTGIEMLSQDLEKLKSAIASEDFAYIARTPGIGKKTAQRVVMELKGKIDGIVVVGSGKGANVSGNVLEEVTAGLEGLGFRRQQVLKGLDNVPQELSTAEEIISYFLKNAA